MQSDVNEIRGHLLDQWPFSRRIGDDHGYIVLAQQRHEFGRHKRTMSNLQSMAQWAIACSLEPNIGEILIVFFRDPRSLRHVAR